MALEGRWLINLVQLRILNAVFKIIDQLIGDISRTYPAVGKAIQPLDEILLLIGVSGPTSFYGRRWNLFKNKLLKRLRD